MSINGDRYDVLAKFMLATNTANVLCVTTSSIFTRVNTFNYHSFYNEDPRNLLDERREKLFLEMASIADFLREG